MMAMMMMMMMIVIAFSSLFVLTGADQLLVVLSPNMEVPEMDGVVPEPGVRDQDEDDLQGSFDPSGHKEESRRHCGLACPGSIEEPGEDVDGLLLYQTEEETLGNALDAETLLGNAAGEDCPEEGADLADQVDEISEGQVDGVSLMEIPEEQLDGKPIEMVLHSIYSEYASPSCSTSSVSPTTAASKSKNGTGLKGEESTDQENYDEGAAVDMDCKNRVLTFSLDPDHKGGLLAQEEVKMASGVPADGADAKPSVLKFTLIPVGGGEKKPQDLELPVKMEETHTEKAVDVYPDSSEFKHGKFLSYPVKSEKLVAKAEHLHYPVKPETPETKAEDLRPPVAAENSYRKPEVLQYAADTEGANVKPEAKPIVLRFSPYPDGAKLKTELEPEDLKLTAFSDTAVVKLEAKPEGLELSGYPESSEMKPSAKPEDLDFSSFPQIKTESKRELLEADSTVLTPKLEQVDGLVGSSESLVERGQVKEERPATPGENQVVVDLWS